jgi:hypothetical protein
MVGDWCDVVGAMLLREICWSMVISIHLSDIRVIGHAGKDCAIRP